jgi:undecaprenyl pyrophosphate phosphatase UppP
MLMSIPTITAAAGYTMLKTPAEELAANAAEFSVGIGVAAVAGLLAIAVLLRLMAKKKVWMFTVYRIALGSVLLIWFVQ